MPGLVAPIADEREGLLAYLAQQRDAFRIVAGIDDLDLAVPVPTGVPGYPDIVRESIYGATMYPLMAAVEGWPASPWMQPWEPASE